jgi:hypothetical protein
MSSTTVTNPRENTKTPTTAPTISGQRRLERTPGAGVGEGEAPGSSTVPLARAATLVAFTPESVDASERVTPAAFVPPSRRSSLVRSGTRTTACLTA